MQNPRGRSQRRSCVSTRHAVHQGRVHRARVGCRGHVNEGYLLRGTRLLPARGDKVFSSQQKLRLELLLSERDIAPDRAASLSADPPLVAEVKRSQHPSLVKRKSDAFYRAL